MNWQDDIKEQHPIQFPTFFYQRTDGFVYTHYGSLVIRMGPGMFYSSMMIGMAFAEGLKRLFEEERAEGEKSAGEADSFLRGR